MKPDPLIEEIWKTKDELARDAGYDVHRFFNELRKWSAEHQGGANVIASAQELRRLAEGTESQRSHQTDMVLRDGQQQSSKQE